MKTMKLSITLHLDLGLGLLGKVVHHLAFVFRFQIEGFKIEKVSGFRFQFQKVWGAGFKLCEIQGLGFVALDEDYRE
jgi:hypothetical protein